MSDLPIALHGENVTALVVGGGDVATRKALAMAGAGVQVRVVAEQPSAELENASRERRVSIQREAYGSHHLGGETLVVAATNSRAVNARVATDARKLGKLVNVADAPDEGNFHTMAIHRSGDVTIAVSAGGVPAAASRIRDAIAARFDERYERAVSALRGLRSTMLRQGGERWREVSATLVGEDFCASVENGSFAERIARWE